MCIMFKCNNMFELVSGFKYFVNEFVYKVDLKSDSNGEEIMARIEVFEEACDEIIVKEIECMCKE